MFKRAKAAVKIILGKAEAISYKKYSCPVCEKKNISFYPLPYDYITLLHAYQHIHPTFLVETLNFEYYSCSSCSASDRDRLYALYFNKVLTANSGKLKVLDIAPSAALTKFLKKQPSLQVRTADLMMQGVDDNVDLTKMDIYQDGQFDFFICSHVLEHIPDDIAAMKELYRILKPGGSGIAMVPINLGLQEVYENAEATSVEDRWKYFGQHDHVRFYSKDGFIDRLQTAGFQVKQYNKDFLEPQNLKNMRYTHVPYCIPYPNNTLDVLKILFGILSVGSEDKLLRSAFQYCLPVY